MRFKWVVQLLNRQFLQKQQDKLGGKHKPFRFSEKECLEFVCWKKNFNFLIPNNLHIIGHFRLLLKHFMDFKEPESFLIFFFARITSIIRMTWPYLEACPKCCMRSLKLLLLASPSIVRQETATMKRQ